MRDHTGSIGGLFCFRPASAQCEKLNQELLIAWTLPPSMIGIAAAGDVGDLTMYTDRYGKKVWFPKSPPKKPPSPSQAELRGAFKAAQASWSALTRNEKAALEDACKRTSIPLTGQNLWIHSVLTGDSSGYLTVQRQSGVILPALP